ncbi:hypothetical protein N303_02194, partial [Cuculus canorus]
PPSYTLARGPSAAAEGGSLAPPATGRLGRGALKVAPPFRAAISISSCCCCCCCWRWILAILVVNTLLVSSNSGLLPAALSTRKSPSLDASYMLRSSMNLLASRPRSSYLSIPP